MTTPLTIDEMNMDQLEARWEELNRLMHEDEQGLLAGTLTKAEAISRTFAREKERFALETRALFLRSQAQEAGKEETQ